MEFLYSNILPLKIKKNQFTIKDCIIKNFEFFDSIDISVGYVTEASLNELEFLVEKYHIKHICLIIGMYFFDGMPERLYKKSIKLNKKWKNKNIGEIKIVTNFKYHGKIYSFCKDNKKSVIIGSPNLSVIKPEASTRRQYESAILIDDDEKCSEINEFIKQLKNPSLSSNIEKSNIQIKKIDYDYLSNIEFVSKIPQNNIIQYETDLTDISFKLPLKVPPYEERFSTKKEYCTKSNLNACYSKPRINNGKIIPRNWFETQITVSKTIHENEYWPTDSIFFIVTDDGYQFKAHTTGQKNKQLSPKGNELIFGYWIKGRLINSGLISPQPNTYMDKEKKGIISKEILDKYGCNNLIFTKTNQKVFDEIENCELDIWFLSFKPE